MNIQKKIITLLSISLFISFLPLKAQEEFAQADTLKIRFKEYTIKKYYHAAQGVHLAEVFQNDKRVYSLIAQKASHIQFVAINDKYTYDINRDSVHNFIFQEYIPGEKDTFVWHILHLGKFEFKLLDKIQAAYTTPWLSDFGNDGTYEIILTDYTFINWNASYLDSPFEKIILRFQDDHYQIDTSLMRKSEFSYPEGLAAEIREGMRVFYEESISTFPYKVETLGGKPEQRWGFISPKLWGTMLSLIYQGKGESAWEFLNQAWYEKIDGKGMFVYDFKSQLSKSPYWEIISQMNSWP